ncbi:P97 family adhesin [Mesomycoplasma dispar]|uniref:P97-like protein n=1 Tax=Mesomycoplasma dispar TaxID=86660 RepID=A0ABM6PQV7_9BACT|nr:hypothetical protein [Mesomycoplasma dispar]ATP59588.1 hypothetical protein CSW10_01350 [Mesomycoplasma dispar]
MKLADRIRELKKNKKAVLILASTFGSLVFFGVFVGISLTIKYNGKHPRQDVKEFAKKVSYVSFKPEKITENSDFFKIKEKLFVGDKLKDEINLNEYLTVYMAEKNSNELTQFSGNSSNPFAPVFEFVSLSFDNLNQNFILKFRVKQKLKNNDFAYSDYFLQPISFYESKKFLKADFNFALQKIVKTINDGVSKLETLITNFSDEKPANDEKILYRAIDFAEKINKSQTSAEVEAKIGEILPRLSNLISQVNKSKDNKIGASENPIFNFQFIKNKTSEQFVSVQNEIATVFLEAKLTPDAVKMLGDIGQSFSSKVFDINLQTKDKKSLFFNVETFFQNVKLKPLKFNTEKKDGKLIITEQNPFDFFAKIKSEFFSAQNSPNYLKKLINSTLVEDLELDFTDLTKVIPKNQTGITFKFDHQNAKLKNENDNYIIELPYKILLSESLFKRDSQKIIYEKELILKISGFSSSAKTVPDLTSNFTNLAVPGTQKELIYLQNPLFIDKEKERYTEFISVYGQPVITQSPLKKEEIDGLLAKQDYSGLAEKLSLPSRYNYNFENFEAKVKSWTGKTAFPSLTEIENFEKNQEKISVSSRNPDQKLEVSSLYSQNFFKNPSDVASFFANLIQKKPDEIANTFFILAKAFGLLDKNRYPLQVFNQDEGFKDIFETAKKINLNNKNINVLSFNNHFYDFYNQGFFSTLFLPKKIKEDFEKLQDKSIIKVVDFLRNQQIFADSKQKFSFQEIEENYKTSVSFTTLADVLLAFYLKAAQLDNFQAWAKLDSELGYQIVFRKGNEISKKHFDSEIEKIEDSKKKSEKNKGQEEQTPQSNVSNSQQTQNGAENNTSNPNNQTGKVKDEENTEYLTLNFYYVIGNISSKKLFFQSPIQKILINFSNKKVDEKAKLQLQLDGLIGNISPELLNFEIDQEMFKKIEDKLSNKNKLTDSGNLGDKKFNEDFRDKPENIKKIKEYFNKALKDGEIEFDFQPSFENMLNKDNDRLKFLLSVSFNPKKPSESSRSPGTSDQSNQSSSTDNKIFASRKLKISVTKKKENNTQSVASSPAK